MPVSDRPPMSQGARFIEAARQLGADKDDGTLDRVLGKVAPPAQPRTGPGRSPTPPAPNYILNVATCFPRPCRSRMLS